MRFRAISRTRLNISCYVRGSSALTRNTRTHIHTHTLSWTGKQLEHAVKRERAPRRAHAPATVSNVNDFHNNGDSSLERHWPASITTTSHVQYPTQPIKYSIPHIGDYHRTNTVNVSF